MNMLKAGEARDIAENAMVSDVDSLFRMIRAAAMVGLYSVQLIGVFNEDILNVLIKSDFKWTIDRRNDYNSYGFTYTISWNE